MQHSFIQNLLYNSASFTTSRMNSWTLSLHWYCLCWRCCSPYVWSAPSRQCPAINAFTAILCLKVIVAQDKTSSVRTSCESRPAPIKQDQSRILRAINRPQADWWRRAGRPRRIWLRTIEVDLRPHNLGLNTAWMRAQDRSKWRQLVETAMLTDGRTTWWWSHPITARLLFAVHF